MISAYSPSDVSISESKGIVQAPGCHITFSTNSLSYVAQKSGPKKRINLDDLEDDGADKEDGEEDRSEIGSQADEEDYDAEEDYGDNDYAENYFDPGEDDDNDALGAGGGDEGGGALFSEQVS